MAKAGEQDMAREEIEGRPFVLPKQYYSKMEPFS
jgi:hypothetical protein